MNCVVFDTHTEGLTKKEVMAIYGRVATSTEDLTMVAREIEMRQEQHQLAQDQVEQV